MAVFTNTTFSDAQTATDLLTVTIVNLPTADEAVLKYDGSVIAAGFSFLATDANKAKLTIDHVSANQIDPVDVSFDIKVTDNDASSPLFTSTTVNVQVQAVNDDPVGTAGSQVITAGQKVTITSSLLTASDVDTASTELTFRLETRPAHGYLYLSDVPLGEGATFTLADIANNSLTYTHDGTQNVDSFSVTLRDGEGGSYLNGALTPLVVSFNFATDIVAAGADDSFSMLENVTGDIRSIVFTASQLLSNDSGNPALSITGATSGANGTAVWNPTAQTVTFTPTTAFNGNATFTYAMRDADGQTSTATVTVNVYPISGTTDSLVASKNTDLVVAASTLLANDVGNLNASGNYGLSVFSVQGATHGTVGLDGTTITFKPVADYVGPASFTYTLKDGDGDTQDVAVSVDIQPVAVANSFSALEKTLRTFTSTELLGNDRGSGLTIFSVTAGTNCTAVLSGGNVLFTPGEAATNGGVASFSYTIQDSLGKQDTATVTVSVYHVAAGNDSFSTPKNTQIILTEAQLLANDSGNGALMITAVQSVSETNYSVTWSESARTVTVAPINDFSGPISFTYTLKDGDYATAPVPANETATATVTVNVTSVPNTVPVAYANSFVIYEDTPLTLTEAQLVGNDTGDLPLNIVSVQAAANGTVQLTGDSDGDGYGDTVIFTPSANFAGTASFTYTIRDATTGDTTTSTASVTVMTLAQNDSPVLTTGTQTGFNEGAVITVTGAALSTTDVDNTTAELVYTLTELPDKSGTPTPTPTPGALYYDPSVGNSLSANAVELRLNDTFTQADLDAGYIKFAHNGGETHVATFKFTVTDGSNYVLPGTATLQDTPVNDQPYFIPGAQSQAVVNEGGSIVIDNTYFSTNDVDRNVDGLVADSLTLSVSELPTQGTLYLDADGNGTFETQVTTSTTFTQAQVDADRLQYVHGNGEIATDSFTLQVVDGQGGTDTYTLQIGIVPINDDPTLNAATGTVSLYEGQQRTLSASDLLNAADVDNSPDEVQYRITTAAAYGQIIRLDVVGSTLQTTGVVLGLNSAFTLQEVQAGRIVYLHDGSETTSDSLVFKLSDSGGGIEPDGTITFNIAPVNDAPTIEVPAALSVSEDQPLAITGIVISDADVGTATTAVATLTVSHGTLNATATGTEVPTVGGAGTATLTITGTLADINATLATLTYTGVANFVGSDSISINVKDGGNTGTDPDLTGTGQALNGLTFLPVLTNDGDTNTTYEQANASVAITVNPVNDAPVNAYPGAQTVTEDTALVFSTAHSNAISISDPDIADGGSYTASVTLTVVNGTLSATADGSATVTGSGTTTLTIAGSATDINATLDGLTYQGKADFYGTDTLSISTTDLGNFGLGGVKTDVDSTAVTITVTAVNDAPTSSAVTKSVAEDGVLTFTLPSSDVGANSITDSVIVDRFRIVSIPSNGVLKDSAGIVLNTVNQLITVAQATSMTFTPTANFNGAVSFTFNAVDSGDLESATQTASITVTAVNDAPVLTGGGDTVAYTEGAGAQAQGTPVVLDANADVGLSDQELTVETGTDTYDGATLTVQRSGGAVSSDRYALSTNGVTALSGKGSITNASATGTLVITFNATATKTDVDAVMRAVTFSSIDDNPSSSVTVAMTFNDGNTVAQGSGTNLPSNALSFTVNITPTNDSPTLSSNLAMTAINEDISTESNIGQTVGSLIPTQFGDVDGNSLAGITIVGDNSATVQGTWQYSLDRTTWSDLPVVTTTSALYLDTGDYLRFFCRTSTPTTTPLPPTVAPRP